MNGLEQFNVRPIRYPDGSLELRLRCQVRFLRAVRNEIRSKQGLPWRQRIRAWRKGFSSSAWALYVLEENDPDLYLNDISSRLGVYRINGLMNPVIDNKLVFSRLASQHGIPQPDLVSVIIEGRMHAEGGPVETDPEHVLAWTLERYPRQVLRPTWSGGGQGVFILERGEAGLTLNGGEISMRNAAALLKNLDRYLATAFMDQASYASAIFPGSVNTLRVLTLWDYEDCKPYVAALAHRFGTRRSAPLDNWHGGRGGICAAVDAAESRLGKGAVTTSDRELTWLSTHPDSGQPIEGVEIPQLGHCVDGITAAAGHFPYCPLIGWDVGMTEDSFSVLEANPLPDFRVWQVHRPLFRDQRNRRFFQRWGLYPGSTRKKHTVRHD